MTAKRAFALLAFGLIVWGCWLAFGPVTAGIALVLCGIVILIGISAEEKKKS